MASGAGGQETRDMGTIDPRPDTDHRPHPCPRTPCPPSGPLPVTTPDPDASRAASVHARDVGPAPLRRLPRPAGSGTPTPHDHVPDEGIPRIGPGADAHDHCAAWTCRPVASGYGSSSHDIPPTTATGYRRRLASARDDATGAAPEGGHPSGYDTLAADPAYRAAASGGCACGGVRDPSAHRQGQPPREGVCVAPAMAARDAHGCQDHASAALRRVPVHLPMPQGCIAGTRCTSGVRRTEGCGSASGGAGAAGRAVAQPPTGQQVDAGIHRLRDGVVPAASDVAVADASVVAAAPGRSQRLDPRDLLRDVVVPTWLAYEDPSPRVPTSPAYAHLFVRSAGIPNTHTRVRGDAAQMQFAQPVIETVDPAQLRPYMTPEEWNVVRVLVDAEHFHRTVLHPDWVYRLESRPITRPSRLTRAALRDLRRKGYFRDPRAPRDRGSLLQAVHIASIACPVFAVIKSDGVTYRLIWDGRRFNHACRPPPPFSITRLPLMLAKLLQPSVRWFLTYDFSTWFVQIRACAAVAALFVAHAAKHDYPEMCGIPMGWAWACVIAHCLTVAFARAVLQALPQAARGGLIFEFCIDNTIIAVTSEATVTREQLLTAIQATAARFNISIKPSSIEHGTSVDWLAYNLNATTHTAKFRDAYIQKLIDTRTRIRNVFRRRSPTLLEAWSIIGLLLFSLYAARIPLTHASEVVTWLAHNAPHHDDSAQWLAQANCPYWRPVWDSLGVLADYDIPPPPIPRRRPHSWSISDAASTGNNVSILFTPRTVTLHVYRCARAGIFEKELCASIHCLLLTAGWLQGERTRSGDHVHFTDNEVSRASVARRYTIHAQALSGVLEHVVRVLEKDFDTHIQSRRVVTTSCIADAWTRLDLNGRAVACGTWTWQRTCQHPFNVASVCPCIVQQVRALGVPMGVFDEFHQSPPAWAYPTDINTAWQTRTVLES